jgi:Tfp pilus assembly protein PilN
MSAPDFSTRPKGREAGLPDLMLLLAGFVAAVLCAGALLRARADTASVQARLADVRSRTAGDQRLAAQLERRAGEGVIGQARLTSEAPPPRVLAELAALLPPDVRLEGLTLAYGRGLEIEMKVVARNPQAYDRLLDRLEKSPRIKGLTHGAESRQGEVQTTVRATFEPGP